MSKELKAPDKVTQKMTRDGAVAENLTTGETSSISERPQEENYSAPAGVAAEKVVQHIGAEIERHAAKGAEKKALDATQPKTHSSRLQFSEAERATPELQKAIKKSDKAADCLDAARAAIPKQTKIKKERVFDEAKGKAKTRLSFEKTDKPPNGKLRHNPLSRPAQELNSTVHGKIYEVEKENVGVESGHRVELAGEKAGGMAARAVKGGIRRHKLKPYREAAKAEQAAFKANVNFQYHKALQENPQLTSNPFSRFMQKQKIKRQYAKTVKKSGAATAKAAAGASQTAAKKAAAFAGRHPAGVIIAIAALLLFIMVSVGLSSCGAMFSGSMNSVLGTSYTSEDSDLVATEQSYAAMENELQQEIDNIESTHSGYDEYRYDLDTIGHNPHELASYLTALLQSYTPQSAQAELKRLFGLQYTLTLTEEIEIRTTTDEEGNEEEYEYRILNVKLTNKPIASLAEELLNPQQFEMFKVYLQTQGNKPLIFGGGSPDGSPSEDLSGVEFVNGTRPGNPELMELAKQQVGNVGGYPYWSWYGFNSRVEWCACFVSWCYNQAGKSEPRFAGCEWQGVPWFQSRGQWGARGYENIAPGDAIFFDWDLDGVADHVGLVLGRDGSHVYTVEGNSGDACKIKSYPLDYACIKGYGLMNWN